MVPGPHTRRMTLTATVVLSILMWARCCLWAAESVDQLFAHARDSYQAAQSLPDKNRKIEALRGSIRELQQVIRQDVAGKVSDRCYYLIGHSYHMIHDINHSREDLKAARESYRTVVQKYPSSPLADDAQYLSGILCMSQDPAQACAEFSKVSTLFPKGDMKPKAEAMLGQLQKQRDHEKAKAAARSNMAGMFGSAPVAQDKSENRSQSASREPGGPVNRLQKIQHWSGADYTRVALYLSDPVPFEEQATRADPQAQQPGRISLNLKNCVLHSKMKKDVRVMDAFLREIHATQVNATQARIVLDTEPIDSYRIFSMADPFRLIVDVRRRKQASTHTAPDVARPPQMSKLSGAPSLAQQLGLNVRRIILDPGHGGKDKGATSPNSIHEKDITLEIAKILKRALEADHGCEVILTRTKDRFMTLEERTAFANTQRADLFISIHTNAHEDRSLHGIETYFLNLSKDKESARVAALENAISTKKISDLEAILHDLMLNTKINESSHLASEVHGSVIGALRSRYENIRDLGVKQAPFYVLLGAEMPSILVETAFITNEREEHRLRDPAYQESLAKAISAGIGTYMRQMKGFVKAGDPS